MPHGVGAHERAGYDVHGHRDSAQAEHGLDEDRLDLELVAQPACDKDRHDPDRCVGECPHPAADPLAARPS